MTPAKALIETLRLVPHPEGGWYRETWRAAAPPGERASATAILFLLQAHQRSHWHRVDAAEAWLWHAGDPLLLIVGGRPGPGAGGSVGAGRTVRRCPAIRRRPRRVAGRGGLPGGHGYSLVSCMVTPAFEFAGFTLADPDWHPGS